MRQIVSTPGTVGGSPRIEGTRLTCANVVGMLREGGFTLNEYLESWDYLSREDVIEALRYCASRQCVAAAVHSFCQHCTLDVEWGKQINSENEQAIRCGMTQPNEPQEDYWQLAQAVLSRLTGSTAG